MATDPSRYQQSGKSACSRMSLPPANDPVILQAVKTSIVCSRASSIHSAPVIDHANKPRHPFRRWMATLHKRSARKRKEVRPREERWSLDEFDNDARKTNTQEAPEPRLNHKKSLSWTSGASSALVEGTRSALLSLSTLSETASSRQSNRPRRIVESSRSDRQSLSLDFADDASRERATKRSQTLDEIIDTEEDYISGLKALLNVYTTLHISIPDSSKADMLQMQQTVRDILSLHEELSNRLRALERTTRFIADGKEAAEAAVLFGTMMSRFFIYEEYGAKYEDMLKNMAAASKNIPNWELYQRGFEMLSNSIAPGDDRALNKKSLSFGDLHIKPIQRICKYPLLFADLFKYTPVIDGPDAHLQIEKTLFRLRETVAEINRATNDKATQSRIQRSWKLQDILLFPEPLLAPHVLRSLGHTTLCGVLHVAYQSAKGVLGSYMLCALFRSCLILAVPCRTGLGKAYEVVASISLAALKLDSVENGSGLQCQTAPFSWKVIFEADQSIFELMLSACSAAEEEQWRSALSCFLGPEKGLISEQFSMLYLDIQSVGRVMGQPDSLLRKIAMQKILPKPIQIIIKNTHLEATRGINVGVRERLSLPVLAPRRADRIQMEGELAEVWTKETLPYPGMQRQHHIRVSATSMLRKLSRSSKSRSQLDVT